MRIRRRSDWFQDWLLLFLPDGSCESSGKSQVLPQGLGGCGTKPNGKASFVLVRRVQLRPEKSESVSGLSWTVGSQLRLRDVETLSARAVCVPR